MDHVLDHAESVVRDLLRTLQPGQCAVHSDDGHQIQVDIRIDSEPGSACFDFSGSSRMHPGNFNAPPAIAKAAAMYVLRCLIDADIPLNEGFLRPIEILLPSGSWIRRKPPPPFSPATSKQSQLLVDALLGAWVWRRRPKAR
ncbi:MAG: hydantoinase B/oxoprolinase family protein [Planctomycetota bacterium]